MLVALVDPSRTVLKFVARMLEERGHEVRSFVEGRDALDYLKSDPRVGVLITSAELNSMSGLELCWNARLIANNRRPLYIILMSSNNERHCLTEALDTGADDFIGKPPVAEELYARLRAAGRLSAMQRELIQLATTDPLTGLLNRRAFFEHAGQASTKARAGTALSAITLDIDHFKRVNDVHGHDVGDATLSSVAKAAAADAKVMGRLGGEEFAILLEGKTRDGAAEFADGLRLKLAALEINGKDGIFHITCSFGVSEWQTGDTIDQMLKRADQALYEAKASGRNRVVVASDALRGDDSASGSGVLRMTAR